MLKMMFKRFIIPGILVMALQFISQANAQAPIDIEDTPWPMYQHDPQHTGRSSFLGPTHQPQLLWTAQLPICNGENGGISIAKDGDLLLSLGGCLHNFDPITRKLKWTFSGDNSRSVPLVATDDDIYWGYGMNFAQISPTGEANWVAELDPNYIFGSSPTFNTDGNLYFVHDGVWSFTTTGQYRWFIPYGWVASHAAPAIGLDGTIYAGGMSDLCAYSPDYAILWCLDTPGNAEDKTPAISVNGIIYLPSKGSADLEPPFTDAGILTAINPSGSVEWKFQPTEANIYGIPDGIAITKDGSIYFGLNTGYSENYLYAIDANGQFKWKASFPVNTTTGLHPFIRYPITVDRAGNAFICPENSRCYGISPDGSILWEFEFPLVDSIIVTAATQPIIAADGLLYVVDNLDRLYAFTDPALYPAPTTPLNSIVFQVEPGTSSFTTTVPISSTVLPITFTASITPTVEWVSMTHATSVTPAELTVSLDPSTLRPGIYHTHLRIMPAYQAGTWLEIPVYLNVNMQQVFLPVILHNYKKPYHILYSSSWFQEAQLASIEQTGLNRVTISHNLDGQIEWMAYAPDGRKVATVPLINDKFQINVLDTLTGSNILEIANPGENKFPAWSPGSDRIAFISVQGDPISGEVYVINLDGTGLTRLTDNQLCETNLFWSPDGEKIAVEVDFIHVYLMNSDGTDFHQLITGNHSDAPEGWSPDGRYLLISRSDDSSSPPQLGIYDLQTSSYTRLTDHYSFQAIWSPDGTQIAYVGWDDQSRFDWDIFVINPDGSGEINITHALDKEDTQPVWSPDSQWISFTSRRDDVYEDPNYDIYIIRPDGTRLTQLTTNIQSDSDPFWKPEP